MIARIDGTLDAVMADRAWVRIGDGLTLEVLLPAATAATLTMSTGQPITLYTHLFLESQGQGATIFPRLAGFLTVEDRAFYNHFTTVKGIGQKRALRAMAMPTSQLATAIEDRDLPLLQSLPEVGKRTAETIVATLRGKLGQLVAGRASAGGRAAGGSLSSEAVDVLVQLGEKRQDAGRWIDQVLSGDDPPTDLQSVIAEVYRIKAGG
jgi:Holliday junction DNA helicase RuvA